MSRKDWFKLKRLGILASWFAGVVVVVIILGAAIKQQNHQEVNDLDLDVDHLNAGMHFLESDEISTMIEEEYSAEIAAGANSKQEMRRLEEKLEKNPYVANVEVFSNVKGELMVEVTQKEPIIRVINRQGVSFYIDRYGEKIPLSVNFTARVPVATGEIEIAGTEGFVEEDSELAELYTVAKFIDADAFWKAMIEQIEVDEKGEMILITKLGNHQVILGNADELDKKFKKLKLFYKNVLTKRKESQYKTINLKFKDQVVCETI